MTLSNARKAAAAASGESKGSGLVSNGLQADGQRRGGGHTTVTTEDIAQERVALLADRQLQLDQVLDKHDDLIRERFHLEHFVTLLGYDPITAKRDDSVVFQDYKAKYDLVEQVTAVVSPSRTTRGAHNRRIMNFTAQSDSQHGEKDAFRSLSASASIGMLSTKAKGKQKMVDSGESVSHSPTPRAHVSASAGYLNGKAITPTKAPSRTSKRGIAPGPPPVSPKSGTEEPPKMPGRPKKRMSFSMTTPTSSPVPLKKRKSTLDGEPASPYPTPAAKLEDASSLKVSHAPSGPASTDRTTRSGLPLKITASPSIRRVRLIVRRPPPSYTNPRQRPPPPRFQSSLESFLRSYTTLNDQDQTEDNLQKMAAQEAVLRKKIDRLQKLGRFFPFTEAASSTSNNGVSASDGNHVGGSGAGGDSSSSNSNKISLLPREPQRPKDAWDHVIEAVTHRNRNTLVKGRQVAAQVASRIQGYWDQRALREKTARVQEEKRLRALAKATIKMVTSEWKKAVFYIREQERLREEAEEKRRGHEHLDAILDQSGQILETQHIALAKGEMSRSQSRSSSVSMDHPWMSSDEDGSVGGVEDGEESGDEFGEIEMEQDAVEDKEDAEGTVESGSEVSEDGDESTRALLGLGLPEDFATADACEHPVPDGLGADSVDQGSVKSAPASLELDAEEGVGTGSHSNEGTEWVGVSHEPSEADSTTQTPTVRESHSPMLEALRDFPTPASSAVALDSGLDANVDSNVPSKVVSRRTSPSPPAVSEQAWVTTNTEGGGDMSLLSKAHHDGPPTSVQLASREGSPVVPPPQDEDMDDALTEETAQIPAYLRPFAIAPVDWSPETKIKPPLLLRGVLRPYQQSGLEWLASLHLNNLNGILADEMGLGKTIQTISLLAHLACDRGIWGPHLIIVPTSVLLNWEMEFKKFLPGFKILSYHGNSKRRKELRQGWYNKYQFNVCITSYALASRDAHIFKRKMWYYMVLDEAHMIKNFKSQRWNILLMFRSFRRLLLTGTPLQNNLTELWALLQFLMSGTDFANLKEFGEWFSNPLEKAIEMGTALDDENLMRVSKLHTVLRPYLLRRLKRDVEKELPSKYEHLVLCPLSKRQRFLYDEFMSRAQTREALHSGVYQKIANILMQLRKVCNHPDLFEVRPVVTSFAMPRSAVADYEIKELLVRRRLICEHGAEKVNLDLFGFRFIHQQDTPLISALETRRLHTSSWSPVTLGEPPPKDTRTMQGYRAYRAYLRQNQTAAQWAQTAYINGLRCSRTPIYGHEMLRAVRRCYRPLLPLSSLDLKSSYMDTVTAPSAMVTSYEQRAQDLAGVIGRFAFVTPNAITLDTHRFALPGCQDVLATCSPEFDRVLHLASVKLQIAFPDPSLLQYDCGKLQELSRLLRQKKTEGHRVLIFTQMTRILDILEIFLNFHGYLYLRLDGATKIEDRQYITERFNADARMFCFISSSRSGGVGINLTGADTVIFYDSDFNPQMDRQCEDRAHRIGQIRDVHIYRFISSHTVEEAMLMKANQKRSLDEIVIQKGEFDWRTIFEDDGALTRALGEFEDTEDAHAAAVAAREEDVLEGANQADFGADGEVELTDPLEVRQGGEQEALEQVEVEGDPGEDGGTISDYMVTFVRSDYEFFRDWRL